MDDATGLIAKIDTSTVAGWNLRALLTLTPLGREVAEQLRPEPWTAAGGTGSTWDLIGEGQGFRVSIASKAVAERIAALLTADDIDKAKRYL